MVGSGGACIPRRAVRCPDALSWIAQVVRGACTPLDCGKQEQVHLDIEVDGSGGSVDVAGGCGDVRRSSRTARRPSRRLSSAAVGTFSSVTWTRPDGTSVTKTVTLWLSGCDTVVPEDTVYLR